MQKWPSTNPLVLKSWNLYWSRKLIQLASSLPTAQRGPLHNLQSIAQLERLDEMDYTSMPAGIKVRFFQATFCDLIKVENFDDLLKGLKLLFKNHGIGGWDDYNKRIEEFKHNQKFRHQGIAWYALGEIDISLDGSESKAQCSIHITYVSPVLFLLNFDIYIPENINKKFIEIISKNVTPKVKISKFFRSWRATTIKPEKLQREILSKFYLSINKSVVKLVRQYIPFGLATSGPLPACCIFLLEDGEHAPQKSRTAFWPSLGMNGFLIQYIREGLSIFEEVNDADFEPTKFLVDVKTFATKQRLEMTGGDVNSALSLGLQDTLNSYIHLQTLIIHAAGTYKEVVGLREGMAKIISGKRLSLREIVRKLLKLNQVDFDVSRISEDVTYTTLEKYFQRVLTSFVTSPNSTGITYNLLQNKLYQLTSLWDSIKNQISILTKNFKVVQEHRLQQRLTYISILGTIIAIFALVFGFIELVPENVQDNWYEWILSKFSKLIGFF